MDVSGEEVEAITESNSFVDQITLELLMNKSF